jgi:hypothetical protein
MRRLVPLQNFTVGLFFIFVSIYSVLFQPETVSIQYAAMIYISASFGVYLIVQSSDLYERIKKKKILDDLPKDV